MDVINSNKQTSSLTSSSSTSSMTSSSTAIATEGGGGGGGLQVAHSASTSSLPVPKQSFSESEPINISQNISKNDEQKINFDSQQKNVTVGSAPTFGGSSGSGSSDDTEAPLTSTVSDPNNITSGNSGSDGGDTNNKDDDSDDDDREVTDEFKTIPTMYTQNNEEKAGFLSDGNMTEVMSPTKIPYSPLVFFYIFFSDHAHEFEIQLPLIRKDLSIEPWKVEGDDNNGISTREMRYILALSNLKLPMGPSESRVIDRYRYILTKDKCVVQRATNSIDIPYGDYFRTESQWTVVAKSDNEYYISATAATHWYKKSLLKSTIESVSIKQIREQLQVWLKNALEYAEKKKDLIDKLNKYIEKAKPEDLTQSKEGAAAGAGAGAGDLSDAKKKRRLSKHRKQRSSRMLSQSTAAAGTSGTATQQQPVKLPQQQQLMQQNNKNNNGGGGGIMGIFYDFVDDLKMINPIVLAVFVLSLIIFIYKINCLESKISMLNAMVENDVSAGIDTTTDTTTTTTTVTV